MDVVNYIVVTDSGLVTYRFVLADGDVHSWSAGTCRQTKPVTLQPGRWN